MMFCVIDKQRPDCKLVCFNYGNKLIMQFERTENVRNYPKNHLHSRVAKKVVKKS